ncbi:competence type IV pilus assembly protein ComGB [Sporolactobacillus nakayamae]|uniref:Competence protein ComGB n=1 Tax=Sporolactobacillus nakayamae TaxID=269670 RepID=A0A1I2VGH2_9BACL|nr:competence type IV pilus assembly protein ComGB [Sporolactobacillus nakayamae]SFG88425.1 competence protein ComGB [Sporolactobacillus nakayamae]
MFSRKKWTRREQAQLLIELGESLKYGYPLNVALTLLANRRRTALRVAIQQISERLKAGNTLHETLSDYKYPKEVTSSIYFAEASGHLSEALIENGQMILRKERYVQTLRRLIRYPLFLLWILAIVLFVVGHFLLPNFIQLYHSLSLELPAITRMMLYLAEHMVLVLLVIAGFILLVAMGTIIFQHQELLNRIRLAARIPLLASFIKLHYTHQFAFQVGGLLRSGLTIKQSVEILSEQGTSPFLKLESKRLSEKLIQGVPLNSAIEDTVYYLPELLMIIEQGGLQSSLGNALDRFSDQLMTRMERQTKWLLSLCQPILLILIGGFVLLLFLSILLPVFHMINGL